MIYTVTLNPALDKTLVATGLEPDVINRARIVRRDWGGKGINVSRALRNLGVESVAMGFQGGSTGSQLEDGLRAMGLATDFVRVEGETRINLTIHDEVRGVMVKLNEAGPEIQSRDLAALISLVEARVASGDIWALSGNLPPGAPPDLYAQLVELIQSGGGRAFLDTSGEALRLGCAARPYAVKPNLEEAATILGRRLQSGCDLRGALRDLLGMGISLAVISLGADGAVIADRSEMHWARPPQVAVQSDIGAGDSLLAGLIWSLSLAREPAESLRWAVACGAAAAMEEGSGVCTKTQAMRIHPAVDVEPLECADTVQGGIM